MFSAESNQLRTETISNTSAGNLRVIRFVYRQVSNKLLGEMHQLIELGEPIAILGPLASGKQNVLASIADFERKLGAVVVSIRCEKYHDEPESFSKDIEKELRSQFAEVEQECIRSHALTNTTNRQDWDLQIENSIKNSSKRVALLVSNIDALPTTIVRSILRKLRRLKHLGDNPLGTLSVVFTGSYDLAPLVYGVESEFTISHQFVLQGFGADWFGEFVNNYAKASGFIADSRFGLELFNLTGGDVLQARFEPVARIHLWDFGGQDIYHGTHALFMRTNAVFLLVWTSASEASSEHEYRGLTFKNHRVPYWLKHIGHLAGFEQPVLIVQNQCDTPRDEQPLSLPEETLKPFRFVQQRHYSALKDRNRAGLDEALREAIADTIQRRGKILIGRGRAAVIAELDKMRRQDEELPVSQRRFRTLGMDAFRELCNKTGGISSVEYFLEYLHDCGLVFYRPGMFNNQIILDQAWALQAIYTVLDRNGPYTALRQLNGRFTRSLLALSAWKEYSAQEQRVFLSMMESCGICFKHRAEDRQLGIEAEYIAPELLPSLTAVAGQIASQWEHPGETVRLVCEYAYEDPSLIRSIVAEIGSRAKESAIYWRFGACGYDLQSSSHFLLDHQADGTNSNLITLECRGPRSQLLANELRKLIESINTRHGMRDAKWSGEALDREWLSHPKRLDPKRLDPRDGIATELELEHADSTELKVQLKLGPSPSSKAKEHFVSYAWGDDTPEGIARTNAISELCDRAKQTGIEIIRDVDHMQIGDRISQFMDRIGDSQRVFVILSEKYLKSEFCMYELWSIWKNCKQNPDQFLSRIRAYKLPCAKISTTLDRLKCAAYWLNQKKEIDELVSQNTLGIIGESDLRKYKCMQDFAAQTSEILSHIADVLKPKNFEDLLEHGFVD